VTGTSTTELLTSQSAYTVGGVPATATTPLSSLDQTTGGAFGANNSILISGTDQNGTAIGPISIPTAGATVGSLVSAINSAYTGATASLNADGVLELTANSTGQSALSLHIQDSSTNTGGQTAFSSMTQAVTGTNGDTNINFQVSDLSGYGNSQNVNLSFGAPNGFSGLTQLGGGSSAAAVKQDGYAQGSLQSATVGTDGTVTGQFSNGLTEPLAQVALATFTNPEGLESTANNYFSSTTNSGAPIVAAPDSGSAGSIQSGSLESSNVDVSTEFTQLVAAERGYQINSQAFSASNQILEEVSSLLSPNG
jgi:flagellar hook protein FlgE